MERILQAIDKVDGKLDKLEDDIVEIKVTMARNTVSLEEHMKRTTALEALVEVHKRSGDVVKADVVSIFTVLYFGRWALSCSAVVGAVVGLYKMLIS